MKLSFFGGAKSVTGANYLLEAQGKKILIDCGFFQGSREEEVKNFQAFPYDPKTIDAVCITHAHLDHIGRLPFLYAQGCKAPLFVTEPTRDLMLLSLSDTVDILKSEYPERTKEIGGIISAVALVDSHVSFVAYDAPFSLGDGISVRFLNSGHILGSSFIEITAEGNVVLFTGDIGNSPSHLFDNPAMISKVDFVIMESVYGDRVRAVTKPRRDLLEDVIEDTLKQGGVLMIPAFAVERTQEVLFDLDTLVSEGRIPDVPVFVDSPLAIAATKIYKKHISYYRQDIQQKIRQGEALFEFPGLLFTETVEESKSINDIDPPKIIIAGSGMSEGGRILHHERRYLSDPASTLLFVGYQALGTRGRAIKKGASEVTILGERVPVRCRKEFLEDYSAHADQEQLVNWAKPFRGWVKKIFLVQGEESASQALSYRLQDFLGVHVEIPSSGETVSLL